MPPDTTVAFFAREDSRTKAPKGLHEAVKKAGGDISAEESVKPWELPKWVIARARELQLELEPDAARALVQHVGDRQQRLLRELEKLALGSEPGAQLDASEIEELTAASAERKAWSLADALVAGDAVAATRLYLAPAHSGRARPGPALLDEPADPARARDRPGDSRRDSPTAQIKRSLRMPSRAADRLIADARRTGADRLRHAIVQIADLELASRGGAAGGAERGHRGACARSS